jgi:hypothetical protein
MSFNLDNYIDVAERIRLAKELYPDFSLQSSFWYETIEGQLYIIVKASAYRDRNDTKPGIGHAWEIYPGKTPYSKGSELMVCETSAYGRALVAIGIGAQRVASKQEVEAAKNRETIADLRASVKKLLHAEGANTAEEALTLVKDLTGIEYKSFEEIKASQLQVIRGALNARA